MAADDADYLELYNQSGVFINLDVDGRDDEVLLGGTLLVTEIGDKAYIKWIAYPEKVGDASEKDDVCTLDGDSSSVMHSEENERTPPAEYHVIDPDWTLVSEGTNITFLKVDKSGKKIQRGSQTSESSNDENNFTVEIKEIESVEKSKRGQGWPSVTLHCKGGKNYPTFHFHDKGCKKFLKKLSLYAYVMPSPKDPNLLQLSHHDDNALTRSFDELQLFENNDAKKHHPANIIKDPGSFALRSFSRVTNFIQDMFVVNDQVRPSTETADVVTHEETEAIGASRIQIKHGKEQSSGFEVITCAQLGPRPEEPRGTPVTHELLETHKDHDGRIHRVDELKWAIFNGGIDATLRKELWKYLLNYYLWDMTREELVEQRKSREEDYYRMKMQWKSIDEGQQQRFAMLRERRCLIEKDVIRTDRTRMFYKEDSNLGLKLLFDILMTYCMYNFDLGYVQGMSDLLSPLLEVMENEVDAFWCFVGYMDMVHHNFEANQAGMKKQLGDLRVLLQFMEPQLWDHLEEKDSSNLYFCFRWLLIHFKREFSYEDIQSVWEVLWTGLPCYNFHLLFCLAVLETEKNNLMRPECGFTEILKHINDLSGSISVDESLRKAYGIFSQLSACKQDLPDSVRHILGLTDE